MYIALFLGGWSLLLKGDLCGERPERGRLLRPGLCVVRCMLYEGHCEALLHKTTSSSVSVAHPSAYSAGDALRV